MRIVVWAVLAAALACGGSDPPADAGGGQEPPPEAEAPVALNPDVPIAYPRVLFDQRIEGDVVLRMFVDSTGRLTPESTRIAESSGYPSLDSAALAGSGRLRFAPAKRRGIPVATAFLQPVEYRHPGSAAGGGEGGRASQVSAPPRVTPPPAPRPQPPVVRPPPPPPPPAVDTAAPVRPRLDTVPSRRDTFPPSPRRDTVPARPDSTRPSTDTTKPLPPADTTRPPTDPRAAAQ